MSTVPRWDLTPIFPGLGSLEFQEATRKVIAGVSDLSALLDRQRIGPGEADRPSIAMLEEVVRQYEALLEVGWTVESYVMALIDTDADDAAATAAESVLRAPVAEMRHLGRRLAVWLRSIDLDATLAGSAFARDRAYALGRLRDLAAHAMPPELEALAAALHTVSGSAWGRLRSQVIASIRAEIEIDGVVERVPLSALRSMANDPDRSIRWQAFDAEAAALAGQAIPLAAALNGVKGETVTLARLRGWARPLEEALAVQGLDDRIAAAIIGAGRAAVPDFRRYLRAKARALEVDRLAWFDLGAPVGTPRSWTFDEATDLVSAAFSRFSPELGELAGRAVAERWIDAEPRAGKQGGGLCYMLPSGRSAIRVDFHGGYDGVRMLAHELGHAYHGAVLDREARPPLQLDAAPASLMETAGKLCEEIVRRELIDEVRGSGDIDGELALLDGFLTGARRSVVDALMNFLLEERLFARRAERDLSADEINAIADELRVEINGNALDPVHRSPWTWAAQPHLYLDGQPFYNLPYLFGQLLSLGLYARYEAEPAGFPGRFDLFLASTGNLPTAELGRSLGIDLASDAFWASGLVTIRGEIDRYEVIVDERGGL